MAEHLDDRAEIHPVGLHTEHAHPAHAVERLDDHVAMLGVEGAQARRITRDERRRDELRKLADRELFRVIADRLRLVEHVRARPLGKLEHPRGRHVFHVERRILAHQHRTERRQRTGFVRGRLVPRMAVQIGRIADDRHALHVRLDARTRPRELVRLACVHRMPAPRRLRHHRVGRILVDLEALERVGDKENVHEVLYVAKVRYTWMASGSVFSSSIDDAISDSRATTPYM